MLIGFIIVGSILIAFIVGLLIVHFDGSSCVETASYDSAKQILTVKFKDGGETKYKGQCTVWHELPRMKRCGTFEESDLHKLWEYCTQHKGNYPTAHLNAK